MTLSAYSLTTGTGWQARDIRCCAGPATPAFEEEHDRLCIAIVLGGTFEYRSTRGRAALAPGAILLGRPGEGFECRHSHSVGDHCLSFHLDPEIHDRAVAGFSGGGRSVEAVPALAPSRERAHLLAAADIVLDVPAVAEELVFQLVAAVAEAGGSRFSSNIRRVAVADRVHDVARWIEANPTDRHSLADLAARADLSPCHLLREFKREFGITPYQFVLSLRLRRAALHLREDGSTILAAALDSGFDDLSEFTRRFRRDFGMTPGAYRRRVTGARSGEGD